MGNQQHMVRIPSIDDLDAKFKLEGSKVLVRVDFNSPIDPKTGKILDDSRIKAHVETIKELYERKCAIVLMSHQGRPGEDDFVSLENHAKVLEKHLGLPVEFIDDVIGPAARKRISELKPGEILLLDNTRLVSEEVIEAVPEKQANTIFVKRLAPLFNFYINDAFATAHRSQPSLVGFPLVLPSAAGRLMEREVKALAKLVSPEERPRIFVLGGGKVRDTLRIIEHLHMQHVADRILTTGLVAELFLLAKGLNIGAENKRFLERRGLVSLLPRARYILLKGAPIETPIDFVTLKDNEVSVEHVGSITGLIRDIGPATIKMYSELMKDAKVVVLRGPAGVIEDPRFRKGSMALVEVALSSNAFTIIGGGHLTSILNEVKVPENARYHVSTGGGALLLFLAGEELPALKALELSAKKFLGW